MIPAGLAKVTAAKKDGSWNKLDRIDVNLETPADLESALKKRPEAKAKWDAQAASQKKMYSWWILQAKRPETRARRLKETIRRVLAGRKAGYWSPHRGIFDPRLY
ncbi:MAG: YdeI/OmpD-associated family protein [Candidatus Aminicenantes bacterium]|nr:YdeI/OmpD-associated family protein [Candidatus Aminicenantes bacterium]